MPFKSIETMRKEIDALNTKMNCLKDELGVANENGHHELGRTIQFNIGKLYQKLYKQKMILAKKITDQESVSLSRLRNYVSKIDAVNALIEASKDSSSMGLSTQDSSNRAVEQNIDLLSDINATLKQERVQTSNPRKRKRMSSEQTIAKIKDDIEKLEIKRNNLRHEINNAKASRNNTLAKSEQLKVNNLSKRLSDKRKSLRFELAFSPIEEKIENKTEGQSLQPQPFVSSAIIYPCVYMSSNSYDVLSDTLQILPKDVEDQINPASSLQCLSTYFSSQTQSSENLTNHYLVIGDCYQADLDQSAKLIQFTPSFEMLSLGVDDQLKDCLNSGEMDDTKEAKYGLSFE